MLGVMGIKSSGNILWKATNKTTKELVTISRETMKMNGCSNETDGIRIDFDISNLAHTLYLSPKCNNSENTVLEVAKFLKRFAHETGFIVTAVLDGDIRPQSKRDSFQRRFTSVMRKINGQYCRQYAMLLSAKVNKSHDDLV